MAMWTAFHFWDRLNLTFVFRAVARLLRRARRDREALLDSRATVPDAGVEIVSSRCAFTELALVLFILGFHLRHELNEFGRLSDAVQKGIALKQGIAGKPGSISLS